MSVVTAMEEAGPCRLKVTIEVPAPAVEAEIGRIVKEFRRQAHLPGFRKGKVPAKLIEKRFKEQIKEEVADRLLPRYWQQAQAEKSIDPLLPPNLEELKMEDGEPMVVIATVETRPEIALGDIDNFELPEESTDVSESDVDDAVMDLRRRFATWNVVEREAATGDLVVGTMKDLDAEADEDDEEGGEPEARPLHLEIGREGSDEELGLALTGKSAGATFEHTSTHGEGEDAHTHRYEIEVREVKEQELPEADEAFIAQLGGDFEDMDGLREFLGNNIEQRRKEDLRERRYGALMAQLRERHPLTLPEGVVQQEAQRMVQDQAGQLARQGYDLESAGLDWGAMADSVRPQATDRVHERLVLDAVAKEKEIKLNEEKFEQFLTVAAAQQGMSSLALRQRLDQEGRLESVRSQMLRDQTASILLGDVDESETEDSSEEE